MTFAVLVVTVVPGSTLVVFAGVGVGVGLPKDVKV